MSEYLRWNDALTSHFFRPEMAGRPIYLYVTDDVITEVGASLGQGLEGFISAVQLGPPWVTREGLCQRALQAMENWRDRKVVWPPYVAYLCLFVLAAGVEGDFARHAYYPRLRELLGYQAGSMLPSFDRMLELWDDLEQWSNDDKSGELGVFEARIAGGWIHVGLPTAQTVLTAEERRALPGIFADADVDPASFPPDEELARVLRVKGAGILKPRTLRLLGTRSDPELYAVLLDVIEEEFSDWDGQVREEIAASTGGMAHVYGTLRLCIAVDPVACQATALLRCKVGKEFPESGLVLTDGSGSTHAHCDEEVPGWSSCLCDLGSQLFVDASQYDWNRGLELRDDRLGWQFRLSGSAVKIFVDGSIEGLPNLVEVNQIPRFQPFYLCFDEAIWPKLERWAEEDCHDFRRIEIRSGLRDRWQLASCARATSDRQVRGHLPALSFSDRTRLRLRGGVRSMMGNNFFSFAPPLISVEGGDGTEEVFCNEQRLTIREAARCYELPAGLQAERKIVVSVRREGDALRRQSLYLTHDFAWRWSEVTDGFDLWGDYEEDTGSTPTFIVGALVCGEVPPTDRFKPSVLLAQGLKAAGARRVFFLGRVPGQVVKWPSEQLPDEWNPVWAVLLRRRGSVAYCGGELEGSEPVANRHVDGDRIRLWKEIFWRRRMRISGPDDPSLAALWTRYQEVARRV